MSVYERPARPPGRHHDDPDGEFRDALVAAIDEDLRVRDAILRLFSANRTPKKAPSVPAVRARIRRRET